MDTAYSPDSPTAPRPARWLSVVRLDCDQISATSVAAAPPSEEDAFVADINSSGSEAQPESSDDSNAGLARRPAWNTPLNGVVEAGSVMGGAVSWPALSESTRPGPRPPSDSPRPVFDGSASSSQPPVIPPPPQRQANPNTVSPRPRSRNRGGPNSSGSGPSRNSFTRPSPMGPPPFPVEVPYGMAPVLDTPLRGPRPVGGVGGSNAHTGNDNSSNRNNTRRNNYGPRPRGDGSNHNNHGGRRDYYVPPPYVPPPMGYMPPPMHPGAPPFMAPHMRVFPGPMGFEMGPPFVYFSTMPSEPFRPPMPPMPMVPPPPSIGFSIIKQIDYYFSDENLVKDNFLRSKMDEHGWVPISLIASFPRVQVLTKDIQVILESLIHSSVVEVQGDKLRRRTGWEKWIHSSARHNQANSGSRISENVVATELLQLSLRD